ncbi:DUF5694 domain-containing protein [Costertonia aggregata]|uniref:Uncharacterized protein n=1 Tax=Costertonia aggregata TaxID=343403 RepID=A0A7H9ALX8_9FLAO|nr:DUF5694 domain-containing protein [Costertonia aggregata]QLG44417.1 hypothetical protein HYG79_03335 [Costertonia aggregata]
MYKIKAVFVLFVCLATACKQNPNSGIEPNDVGADLPEVLLIGTFHYNNPGADVVKTKSFDILNDKSQKELEFIASKIKEFGPSKIFVEWDYDEQVELDSLYGLYQNGKYFSQDSLSEFYKKNEIFQLAFRTAHKNDLNQVIGIDYGDTQFPFDSVMTVIQENKQIGLQSKIEDFVEIFTLGFDSKIEAGISLVDLTYYLNSNSIRNMSNEFHDEIPLQVGKKDNFIGPFLTSEWYKRNLYMWSLILKNVNEKDKRIMVLVGASHAAKLEQIIDQQENWKIVQLKSLLE